MDVLEQKGQVFALSSRQYFVMFDDVYVYEEQGHLDERRLLKKVDGRIEAQVAMSAGVVGARMYREVSLGVDNVLMAVVYIIE